MSAYSGPEPPEPGWEAFQSGRMAQSLLLGETYLGGSSVLNIRGDSDSRAAGQVSGRQLAQVWGWAPLSSLLRQGKWGRVHWLLATVSSLLLVGA